MKYFRVWRQLASMAFGTWISNRIDSIGYFLGKLIRFGFLLLMIISIFNFTDSFAGYTKYETLLFFLTFNLIDVGTQAFMRGIYIFGTDINKGKFDYILSRPLNALFHSLVRLTDLLDLIFLIPIIGIIIFITYHLSPIPPANILLYITLLAIGFVIITAIHIMAAAFSIWSFESQGMIWFYRDAISLTRFPPEVLPMPLQLIFTYIMPVFVMVAFPAKALLGILSVQSMILGILIAAVFFSISLVTWHKALRAYSSASS